MSRAYLSPWVAPETGTTKDLSGLGDDNLRGASAGTRDWFFLGRDLATFGKSLAGFSEQRNRFI
jgi:hypothetical protein